MNSGGVRSGFEPTLRPVQESRPQRVGDQKKREDDGKVERGKYGTVSAGSVAWVL